MGEILKSNCSLSFYSMKNLTLFASFQGVHNTIQLLNNQGITFLVLAFASLAELFDWVTTLRIQIFYWKTWSSSFHFKLFTIHFLNWKTKGYSLLWTITKCTCLQHSEHNIKWTKNQEFAIEKLIIISCSLYNSSTERPEDIHWQLGTLMHLPSKDRI